MKSILALLALVVVGTTAEHPCICTREYNPICGSNGVTYANPCLLRCAASQNENKIIAVHYGACAEQLQEHPCVCTKEYRPVCGSDGVTYANHCLLRCADRQSQNGITVAHSGPCTEQLEFKPCVCTLEFAPVCGSDGITYPNKCSFECKAKQTNGLTMVGRGVCETVEQTAMCACNKMLLPVCGSDGVTYNNPCLLNCQRKENADLTLVHYGACKQELRENVCACDRTYVPVCGSDGVTYSNPCLLNCQRKVQPDLKMLKFGSCVESRMADPCRCTREYMPVCGTDGVSYPNKCVFNCKNQYSDVTIAHAGTCEVPITNLAFTGACPLVYKPVCGSDGHTYTSGCMLELHRRREAHNLRFVHNGPCEPEVNALETCACTDDYRPVCGSDGVTYGNMCGFNCQRKQNSLLHLVNVGECAQPACPCDFTYFPMCGSNGVTYANQCTMRCAQKTFSELTLKHAGEC